MVPASFLHLLILAQSTLILALLLLSVGHLVDIGLVTEEEVQQALQQEHLQGRDDSLHRSPCPCTQHASALKKIWMVELGAGKVR